MEPNQQFLFLDGKKCGRRNGCNRAHADRLTRHAALAKKIPRAKHREHSHLTRRANYGEFYAALLDVHDAHSRVTLTVNLLVFPKFSNLSCHSRSIEKTLRLVRFRRGFLHFHRGAVNGPTGSKFNSEYLFSVSRLAGSRESAALIAH